MAFNEMSMNTNYVDARTPEEIANAPKGVITYASSMNNNTLKERKNWEDDFDNLKIKYQTSKGIVLDDITLLDDETTDTIKAFISTLIQQAKEEERNEIRKNIGGRMVKIGTSDFAVKETGMTLSEIKAHNSYADGFNEKTAKVIEIINQLSNTK